MRASVHNGSTGEVEQEGEEFIAIFDYKASLRFPLTTHGPVSKIKYDR